MASTKPRALVTGGAGFIGSHLVDHLVRDLGADVMVLDDLSAGDPANVHAAAELVEGSVLDGAAVEAVMRAFHPELVFHLAAFAAEGLSVRVPRHTYTTNVLGSVNVIGAAAACGVQRLMFTSSAAVYGHGADGADEDTAPAPIDPYGISKVAVEQHLRLCRERFGLRSTVARLHNVYGERQALSDPARNVVGIFANQLLRGEPLSIHGDGTQRRAFTYIGDVVPLLAQLALRDDTGGSCLNIGSDEAVSVNELAERLMETMGLRGTVEHVDPRSQAASVRVDHARCRALFPDAPRTPLAQGLELTASWALAHGPVPFVDRVFPEIDPEIVQGPPRT